MKRRLVVAFAAATLAGAVLASGMMEAVAAPHGRGGPAVGARSFSSGARSFAPGRSFGTRSYSRTYRSPAVGSRAFTGTVPRVYGRTYHGRRHVARRHHGRYFYGVPLATYGYYYGYADSCYYLRQRALDTGSGYWWNRYYDCINGDDYY